MPWTVIGLCLIVIIGPLLLAWQFHGHDFDWLTSGAYAAGCLLAALAALAVGCWALFAFTNFGY